MDRNHTFEMRKIMHLISLSLICLFQACSESNPNDQEIIGTWMSKDGGEFQIEKNGTFIAKDLLWNILFKYSNNYKGKTCIESGTWEIERWQGQWVVSLSFTKSENLPKGYATRILISGTGILENKPPWNLFLWKEEEGGERYIFEKK